jgi:hypothetical protein
MKMIRSIPTICDNILSYNVALDYPLYSSATTYSKGDRVTDTACGAKVYESIANANTGYSLTDTAWWVYVGTSNYFAMFDNKTGTQTQRAGSIEVEVAFDSLVNSVALINVEADTARFEAWDQFDEKIIDFTVELRDYGSTSWYDSMYSEITFNDRPKPPRRTTNVLVPVLIDKFVKLLVITVLPLDKFIDVTSQLEKLKG